MSSARCMRISSAHRLRHTVQHTALAKSVQVLPPWPFSTATAVAAAAGCCNSQASMTRGPCVAGHQFISAVVAWALVVVHDMHVPAPETCLNHASMMRPPPALCSDFVQHQYQRTHGSLTRRQWTWTKCHVAHMMWAWSMTMGPTLVGSIMLIITLSDPCQLRSLNSKQRCW